MCRQNTFRIKDSLGNVRIIQTRYVRSYPVENNEWGDFQVKHFDKFNILDIKTQVDYFRLIVVCLV